MSYDKPNNAETTAIVNKPAEAIHQISAREALIAAVLNTSHRFLMSALFVHKLSSAFVAYILPNSQSAVVACRADLA